jgi:hypothetical protein
VRRPAPPAFSPRAIIGTWQLVWPETADHEREIKLITPTHFTWTTWNTTTHEVLATGGGPWTLVGSNYCEQLLFAKGAIESRAGQVLCFDLQVKGDTLIQVGQGGSPGSFVREIWRRLR